VEAVHADVADFVTANFRRFYVEGYRVAVNYAPALWGRLYRYNDRAPDQNTLLPLLQRAQHACASAFFAYLHRFRPDRILSTHFLIPQLLSADRRFTCLNPSVESIITDYEVHRFWVSDIVSRYYVAHEQMVAALARYGVPVWRVTVSGIPVHPCFSDPVSNASILEGLGLDPDRPVIMMLAGGLGLNELSRALQQIFTLPRSVQIITVSGKNEALRARLDKLQAPASVRLLNLGFVRNMHELLSISDLVITKPGGLTVSECLAKNKLMILFSPIPGQEAKNAEFLVERGAAVQVNTLDELPQTIEQLLRNPLLGAQMLAQVKACARPLAAYTIAETIAHAPCLAA
jgi:processive 1,2-diacylglycerol beta-glucosyltransferase